MRAWMFFTSNIYIYQQKRQEAGTRLSSVPFTGCIQGGLHEGKTITVTGRVLPNAKRFHVNLQCGSKEKPDVALHFNPRYESKHHVVCNTMYNSKWGPEELKYYIPMTQEEQFTLMFLVNQNSYSLRRLLSLILRLHIFVLLPCAIDFLSLLNPVSSQVIVNGAHFMEYLHRMSITQVDTIFVYGGVEIESIDFSNSEGSEDS
uniref:galectin-9-like n=1 Tax=Oncorhynchus gorbuscha TaxID=8017 RepID=UPI001EAF20DD|nr:galectin-9-like [Oncorhynchus gorbuscha]